MPEIQVIEAKWLLPISPRADSVLTDHSLVIEAGRIRALMPQAQARAAYPDAHFIVRPHHVLMPGLINFHCHAAMTLLRGLGDDLPLQRWLGDCIWPTEAALVSDPFVFDGSVLACHEMLLGGITCFNDMYFFPEATIRAAQAYGMRIVAGITVIDLPTRYAKQADEYLAQGLAIHERWQETATVHFSLAPHAPYTVSDAVYQRLGTLAETLDLPIHTHLHETEAELTTSMQQYGCRPLERLARLGLLSPRLIAVHGVHFTSAELAQLATAGAHLAHCPSSNLKLASGLPALAAWQATGINFGLGTDGAASNNRLDLWAELRLAALLAKGVSGDPTAGSAASVLEAATLGAARALGLDEQIGSLAGGKAADCLCIDLGQLQSQPCYDIPSHLVYVCGREQVSDVWVAGQHVVNQQQITLNSALTARQQCLASLETWQIAVKQAQGGNRQSLGDSF
ncbi:TRZ/ATZ family hydrolase [Parvibium lacunae]|uniref:TRZ/ATZ family hydrolase n=2 Tax=Parvibium lacunae TaxID=1888893 RepID=A0A368L886_9BURK|nr:TRZ/ATZ family hydrolase [Parvibium lacunae]